MGYVENSLSSDEIIMAKIKHSWAGLICAIFKCLTSILFGIVLIVLSSFLKNKFDGEVFDLIKNILLIIIGTASVIIAILIFIRDFMEIKFAQLVVTNKRLLGRRGFISKQTMDILLSKIDTINVDNGFLGAIFHYGEIQVISSGMIALSEEKREAYKYRFISNTNEFKRAVLQAIEKVKEEERLAQAQTLSQAIKSEK